MRVLVAEDDLTSRKVLQSAIGRWGYDVVSARDGIEAWSALQQSDAPALLVLDWMMPGMDGVDVCRRLRQAEGGRPSYIILLTARDDTQDLVTGLNAGANDYVGKPFDPDELRARLQVGRRYIELYDELLATQQALERLARTDPLTQLLNRGAILTRLSQEMTRARRNASHLSLGMLDIDHFKRVNDTYGHAGGDEVLREVARRIAGALRPYDAPGRFGGEEFLLLVPGTTEDEARRILEKVRRAVGDAAIEFGDGAITLTVSIGGAGTDADEPDDAVLLRADEALYRAKERGRNRVEMAREEGGRPSPTG